MSKKQSFQYDDDDDFEDQQADEGQEPSIFEFRDADNTAVRAAPLLSPLLSSLSRIIVFLWPCALIYRHVTCSLDLWAW